MVDLKTFDKNIALIAENSEMDYRSFFVLSNSIGDAVNRRCLVFLLAKNSVESIAGYFGFLNKKIVPMMIDAELNISAVKNLVEIYRPEFIYLPENF